MTVVLIVVLVGLGALLATLVRGVRNQLTQAGDETRSQLEQRSADVDRRLQGVIETMDRRLADLDTKVDRRLVAATQTTTKIHEQLGQVSKATAEMIERAKDLGRLEQALRPPKARGGFGELLLENLLRDRLPPSAYELQYTFRGGERVDAVIRVEKLVPVDAKFPLDNFERMVEADADDERALHEKAFGRDVRGHVDAIAEKYIRPGEGTYDFGLMYLPSEAIYYELVCGKTGRLLTYAHEQRVFPVSATTFVAYLQVIAFGLKGLQIEQTAQEVMAYTAALQGDFARFKDDFALVGKHLGNAQSKFGEAEKRLGRFEGKLERAAELQPDVDASETPALPRVVDAA
jgi:DNA recombination protein RmuC